MRLILHPKVSSDINEIMEYYEKVANPQIAKNFYADLRRCLILAINRPESFAIRECDLRRVNLDQFPYHFLYRIAGNTVVVWGEAAMMIMPFSTKIQ